MSNLSLEEYADAIQYSLITYQLRRSDKIVEVLIKLFSKQDGKGKKKITFKHEKIEDFIERRNREPIFEINS